MLISARSYGYDTDSNALLDTGSNTGASRYARSVNLDAIQYTSYASDSCNPCDTSSTKIH
jgi:hypothetical protein